MVLSSAPQASLEEILHMESPRSAAAMVLPLRLRAVRSASPVKILATQLFVNAPLPKVESVMARQSMGMAAVGQVGPM